MIIQKYFGYLAKKCEILRHLLVIIAYLIMMLIKH
ncbi:hypothetical protein ES705_17209 [subsurface metagenome]